MFCKSCGAECSDNAVSCPKCGEPLKKVTSSRSRLAYILLGLFLSPLGIHDFYIGRYWRGILWLLYTVCLGWLLFTLVVDPIVWVLEVIFTTTDSDGNRLA